VTGSVGRPSIVTSAPSPNSHVALTISGFASASALASKVRMFVSSEFLVTTTSLDDPWSSASSTSSWIDSTTEESFESVTRTLTR
jgi:hypothetical protein